MSSAVTAFCMMAAMAVPFGSASITADAAAWRCGDLNGDGVVNSIDATILQGYLYGRYDITHHGTADLDFDGAITMADLSRLSKYLVGSISLPTTANNITAPQMESRSYVLHDYRTNSDSYYYLNGNVSVFSEDGISPYADNIDDRVRATDTSVVQVTSGGTGFIVDNHVIATAAHCLFNSRTGKFVDDLKIVVRGAPYSNTSKELCTCQVVETHIPMSYYNNGDDNYDYALIYVEEDLSQYGMFDLGVPSDEFMDSETTVITRGYPGDTASNPSADNMALYESVGTVLNLNNCSDEINKFEYRLTASYYTSGGNSGGPIYYTGGDGIRTVIGIHTGSGYVYRNNEPYTTKTAFGTRIIPSLLQFYYNNNFIGSSMD